MIFFVPIGQNRRKHGENIKKCLAGLFIMYINNRFEGLSRGLENPYSVPNKMNEYSLKKQGQKTTFFKFYCQKFCSSEKTIHICST